MHAPRLLRPPARPASLPAVAGLVRVIERGDVTLALGLLPIVLVGLAALIVFLAGAGAGAHRVGRASHAPAPAPSSAARFGGSWARTTLTSQTNALLEDPRWPDLLVAGTADGAWLSADGGLTWQRAGSGLGSNEVLSLAASPAGQSIFAGASDGAVYVHTAARTGAWTRISAPLGADHPIFSLAVSPRAGRAVLAGTFGALYRGTRTAAGWTWRRVATTSGGAALTSILWAPWDARLAFACAFASAPAVLATHDGGRTWQPDADGLPASLPTQALLVRDVHTRQIILSTMGGGVWLQAGAGRWRDVSAGLPARHAMPLAQTMASAAVPLYAGTMGFGVYVKEGGAPWRRLGRGLNGGAYTLLALLATSGHHPALLAGTARGLFHYVPPARSSKG